MNTRVVATNRRWRCASVLAVLLSACGAASARSVSVGGKNVPAALLETSVAALCNARAETPTNSRAARSIFYNQSHQNLHIIAQALENTDRAEAARLLEAMYRVETDMLAQPAPAALTGHFEALTREAGTALSRLSLSKPACTSR